MSDAHGCIVEEAGDTRLKWLLMAYESALDRLIEMGGPLVGGPVAELRRLSQDIHANPPKVIVRLQNGGASLEQAVSGVVVEVRDYDVGGMSAEDALNFGCTTDEEGHMYQPIALE